ncbi:MAG: zinc ABC transporter substrate-binding protein [Bacteroidetes bacterium]|nr:MAG: zinc ABC transporter substrate-binding protein [Bacteroidota bacterium]
MIYDFSRVLAIVVLSVSFASSVRAQNKLNVVTTLPDLESIVYSVGGDLVEVTSIATGYQNPHFVDPKPSFIMRLTRADMFVTVGLDLETGWVPSLLNSARNPDITPGSEGYVDTSINIPLLDVPSSVSREQGDIHVFGNPHYWLDPENGKIMAETIRDALVRLQPESATLFDSNLESFLTQIDIKIEEWNAEMKPYKGQRLIAYHNQWPYLEAAFGVIAIDFLEPKPGIPPTPSQLAKIISLMKQESLSTIIIAPYFRTDSADLVARNVSGNVVILAASVGAFSEIKTYFDLFDYNIARLKEAFDSPGS